MDTKEYIVSLENGVVRIKTKNHFNNEKISIEVFQSENKGKTKKKGKLVCIELKNNNDLDKIIKIMTKAKSELEILKKNSEKDLFKEF